MTSISNVNHPTAYTRIIVITLLRHEVASRAVVHPATDDTTRHFTDGLPPARASWPRSGPLLVTVRCEATGQCTLAQNWAAAKAGADAAMAPRTATFLNITGYGG